MLALLSAAVTGCGGGSGGPAPASCTQMASVRVQLFGDSTQLGFLEASPTGVAVHNPAAELQAYFDRLYPGRVTVTSRAVNGSSAHQLLIGDDTLNLPWPRSVNANIVVINHGINDWLVYRDVPAYVRDLQALSTAGTAIVVFETPNVIKTGDLAPYAQAMRDVAREKGLAVADTYAYTSGLPNGLQLLADNVHPSEALYELISRDVLQPTVGPIVQRLLCGS
jgi:lysophospholipase L1-like esterase